MNLKRDIMTNKELIKALSIVDLSDENNGKNALNIAVLKLKEELSKVKGWPTPEIRRSSPITTLADNYDRLYFPEDNIGRSSTYTRYITEEILLRTHSTAMIPHILKEIAENCVNDYMVMCPGICYRRDVVDRIHTGEPHQLDIWRIKKGEPRLKRTELIELVETIINIMIPGYEYRANEVIHPYTINGLEIEIKVNNEWLELLECGEAHPSVLRDAGLNPKEYSGLAAGIGIERIVMIMKRIDDIRVFRSNDPRIKKQMENLDQYIPVSNQPAIKRDMSISIDESEVIEDISEAIKNAIGNDIDLLEEIEILSETPYGELPPQAIERLDIAPGQKNVLIRITLRSHERSLTQEEANVIRDKVHSLIDKSQTGGYISK